MENNNNSALPAELENCTLAGNERADQLVFAKIDNEFPEYRHASYSLTWVQKYCMLALMNMYNLFLYTTSPSRTNGLPGADQKPCISELLAELDLAYFDLIVATLAKSEQPNRYVLRGYMALLMARLEIIAPLASSRFSHGRCSFSSDCSKWIKDFYYCIMIGAFDKVFAENRRDANELFFPRIIFCETFPEPITVTPDPNKGIRLYIDLKRGSFFFYKRTTIPGQTNSRGKQAYETNRLFLWESASKRRLVHEYIDACVEHLDRFGTLLSPITFYAVQFDKGNNDFDLTEELAQERDGVYSIVEITESGNVSYLFAPSWTEANQRKDRLVKWKFNEMKGMVLKYMEYISAAIGDVTTPTGNLNETELMSPQEWMASTTFCFQLV